MSTRRPERQPSARRTGTAYQGALEAVMAIVIAMGIGAFADTRFDTAPVLLLLGLGIGFGSFILRLWRLSQQLGGAAQSAADAAKNPTAQDAEANGGGSGPGASAGEADSRDR